MALTATATPIVRVPTSSARPGGSNGSSSASSVSAMFVAGAWLPGNTSGRWSEKKVSNRLDRGWRRIGTLERIVFSSL